MPFVFAVSRNNEYAKDYRRSPRRIGASPTCSPRARIDALPVLRRGSAARYRLRVLFCSLPVRRVRARQSDASAGSTGLECAYYIRCRARRTWPGLEIVKVRVLGINAFAARDAVRIFTLRALLLRLLSLL